MANDALIPAHTWTFEPAVPACGRTSLVAEMLKHTGVQNRQSAEKTKQPRYFAAHMALLQELTSPIKGTFKELMKGAWKKRERKKLETREGDSIEPLQAVELADGNCQVLRLGIVRNTIAYSVEHNNRIILQHP
ncbi:hypothetical protein GQ457_17G006320 [Hibiscus cannabinus]